MYLSTPLKLIKLHAAVLNIFLSFLTKGIQDMMLFQSPSGVDLGCTGNSLGNMQFLGDAINSFWDFHPRHVGHLTKKHLRQ